MADFFGFEINRKGKAQLEPVSIVPSTDADGAGVINSGGHFGAYLDLDADKAQNEVEQLLKYRDIASQPECDAAIEDIVNEAIVGDHNESPVNIILDKLQVSDKVKTIVREEFMNVLSLMQFNSYSHDIFRKWYIDGRLPYHVIIDEKNPKGGIRELRYIDPLQLRKIKKLKKKQILRLAQNLL
jgi:hypothetical protein